MSADDKATKSALGDPVKQRGLLAFIPLVYRLCHVFQDMELTSEQRAAIVALKNEVDLDPVDPAASDDEFLRGPECGRSQS